MKKLRLKPPLPVYRTESQEQILLFRLIDMHMLRYPDLQMVYAVPNGGYKLPPQTIGRLTKEGLRRGYPDINCDVAKHGFHGLRIEMKSQDPARKASDEQQEWRRKLLSQGYACELCHGYSAAWRVLTAYLDIGHLAKYF